MRRATALLVAVSFGRRRSSRLVGFRWFDPRSLVERRWPAVVPVAFGCQVFAAALTGSDSVDSEIAAGFVDPAFAGLAAVADSVADSVAAGPAVGCFGLAAVVAVAVAVAVVFPLFSAG